MPTEKQQYARARNWMILQVRGALASVASHKNLSVMTKEEQHAAYDAEAALNQLMAAIRRNQK